MAPNRHLRITTAGAGLVKTINQRRNYVAARLVIVARPVNVRRHYANEIIAILAPICLAELETRNLGQGVRFIGWLQWPRQQILLFDGLRAMLWIHAGAAQEHQLFGYSRTRRNHIALNLQ